MKNTMDDASISWQNRLIEGLEKGSCPVSLLNFLPVKSWPRGYAEPIVKSFKFSHNNESEDYNVGFCNIFLIKRLIQSIPIKKRAKKWLEEHADCEIVFSYTLYPEFLSVLKQVKKNKPSTKTVAIVLDLPEYCILTKKMPLSSRLYLNWSKTKARKLLKYVDIGVFLTKQMIDALDFKGKSLVIEGMASKEFEHQIPLKKHDGLIHILYAGTLHKRFGVVTLLDAFQKISKENYRLIICGNGDSVCDIKKRALQDPRIDFRGQLSRREIIDLMLSSNMIVNPRQNNEEFVKYSFPSKNLEALSSGVPLLAYKLPGIPNEYDEYINYINGGEEAMADLIVAIGEDGSGFYSSKALKAKEWVFREKNLCTQSKKIVNFIKDYETCR